MELFTIGYTGKSAQEFFELIKSNKIDTVIDVRLYNSTQLAAFSKSRDLKYFLSELCNCSYVWASQFAPSKELFENYKNGNYTWTDYEKIYNDLLQNRGGLDFFEQYKNKRICLLCAEKTPEKCHRRLLSEKIALIFDDVTIVHL